MSGHHNVNFQKLDAAMAVLAQCLNRDGMTLSALDRQKLADAIAQGLGYVSEHALRMEAER